MTVVAEVDVTDDVNVDVVDLAAVFDASVVVIAVVTGDDVDVVDIAVDVSVDVDNSGMVYFWNFRSY